MKSILTVALALFATQAAFAFPTVYKCQGINHYELTNKTVKNLSYKPESFTLTSESMRNALVVTTDHSYPQDILSLPVYTSGKVKSLGVSPLVEKVVGIKSAVMNPDILVNGGTSIIETSCLLNRGAACKGFSYYLYLNYYTGGGTPEGEIYEYICK